MSRKLIIRRGNPGNSGSFRKFIRDYDTEFGVGALLRKSLIELPVFFSMFGCLYVAAIMLGEVA